MSNSIVNGRRRALANGGKRFKAAECGTRSGFKRHKKQGEVPCGACRIAEQQRNRARQAKIMAAKGETRDRVASYVAELRAGMF